MIKGDIPVTDRSFLIQIYHRLHNLEGVSEDIDYLRKFRSIIECIPYEQYTPNVPSTSSIEEMERKEVY